MRLRADTVIGALLIILFGAMFMETYGLPKAPYGTMGPALFPRLLLIGLFPLSLVLFFKGLLQDIRERRPPGRPFRQWFDEYRNVLASYALFFFLALALPYAGYLISGFIFLFAMQLLLGPKSWGKVPQYLAVSVGVLAGLFLLFRWFLLVILPEGEILEYFEIY